MIIIIIIIIIIISSSSCCCCYIYIYTYIIIMIIIRVLIIITNKQIICLFVSLSLYIYIYIHTLYVYIHLSLSMCIYIYIYIHYVCIQLHILCGSLCVCVCVCVWERHWGFPEAKGDGLLRNEWKQLALWHAKGTRTTPISNRGIRSCLDRIKTLFRKQKRLSATHTIVDNQLLFVVSWKGLIHVVHYTPAVIKLSSDLQRFVRSARPETVS